MNKGQIALLLGVGGVIMFRGWNPVGERLEIEGVFERGVGERFRSPSHLWGGVGVGGRGFK